ncbi:MAG: hypothetical protein FD169_1726 [Bacillota bacterium]|nr:MAG: hypothetical protein FD169_1726 [Bacillota bacterium]MBS3950918.1 hypothetical protein [Peptococcaceae bacterium]
MTEKKTVAYKCVGCGLISEVDTGFGAAVVPAPEMSIDHFFVEQAQVFPLELETEEKPTEPCVDCTGEHIQEQPALEEGLYYNIGDCPECGSHHWAWMGGLSMALPPIEEVSPVKPQENQDECAEYNSDMAETGFSTAVAPTPEVSNEYVAQQYATSSLSEVDPAPKKKIECTQCGRIEEIDINVNEIPSCITCGSADWGQVPH